MTEALPTTRSQPPPFSGEQKTIDESAPPNYTISQEQRFIRLRCRAGVLQTRTSTVRIAVAFGNFSDRSDNAKSPLVDLTVQCPTQIAIGLDGGSNTALLVSATLADSRVSTSLQPIADRIQGTLTFSHSQPHETNAPSVDHWPTHQVTVMTWLSTAHAAASDISMAPLRDHLYAGSTTRLTALPFSIITPLFTVIVLPALREMLPPDRN